jgi:hypothetical protein
LFKTQRLTLAFWWHSRVIAHDSPIFGPITVFKTQRLTLAFWWHSRVIAHDSRIFGPITVFKTQRLTLAFSKNCILVFLSEETKLALNSPGQGYLWNRSLTYNSHMEP